MLSHYEDIDQIYVASPLLNMDKMLLSEYLPASYYSESWL